MWTNTTPEEFDDLCARLGRAAAFREVIRRATPMECMSKVADRYHKEAMERIDSVLESETVAA